MYGVGTYRYADGAVYDGSFLKGKKNGKGKYISTDGTIF